jgi:predicted ATPase
MLIALGASLRAVKGYAASEVGETYTYARQLCQSLDNPHQLFPVLRGLWDYYNVRGESLTARELGEQILTLAEQVQDAAMLVVVHRILGSKLFYAGAVADAHTHFAQGIALYDSQQHHVAGLLYGEDDRVACRSFAARTLWFLGYPDQGLAQSQQGVTLAQQRAHPLSLDSALRQAAMFHQFRREVRVAQERAEASIRLATEQGLPYWIAFGTLLRGWALTHQGQAQAGVEQMHQGLTAWRANGAEIQRPYFLALLAEAYGTMGQPETGLTMLAEALTVVDKTGERWYEAEIHRLKGELLLQQSSSNQAEAETCFHHALEIARNQQAKSLELRAVMSLSRLWQQQGKRQEAHDLLAPVYEWFTEGFDTLDLMDAKALLEALA